MTEVPESLLTIRGQNEAAKPFLDDLEIVQFVRRFSMQVSWEHRLPNDPADHPGRCVEGNFLYDSRHTLWKPNYLGALESFSRWDWCGNIAPFGGCGMLFTRDMNWTQMPNYIQAAFRYKVVRFYGSPESQPGAWKRVTGGAGTPIRPVEFKHYA